MWHAMARNTMAVATQWVRNLIDTHAKALAVEMACNSDQHDTPAKDCLGRLAEMLDATAMMDTAPGGAATVSINALVDEALRGAAALCKKKLRIALQLSPQQPEAIGQPEAIRQAIYAMLVNASAACDQHPGGETRTVTISTGAGNGRAWISVADQCGGVPPDLAERLGEPFVSGDSSRPGVSIALAKEILSWHGGAVRLNNNPGVGVEFIIDLKAKE